MVVDSLPNLLTLADSLLRQAQDTLHKASQYDSDDGDLYRQRYNIDIKIAEALRELRRYREQTEV